MKLNTFPILTTPDLSLREILGEDAPLIQRIRSDSRILEFMDRNPLASIQATEKLISTLSETFNQGESTYWGLELKQTGKLVGTGGFHRWERVKCEAEIAYELLPQFWRRGFASQALRAMIEYGFEQMELQKIIANVNPKNFGSRRILEKFHFKQEAYFKEDFYFNGKYLDTVVYVRLKSNSG